MTNQNQALLKQSLVRVLNRINGDEAVKFMNHWERLHGGKTMIYPLSEFNSVFTCNDLFPLDYLNMAIDYNFNRDSAYFAFNLSEGLDDSGSILEFYYDDIYLKEFDVCIEDFADEILERNDDFGIPKIADLLGNGKPRWHDRIGEVFIEGSPQCGEVACMYISNHEYLSADNWESFPVMYLRDDRFDEDAPLTANDVREIKVVFDDRVPYDNATPTEKALYHTLINAIE